MSDFPLRDEAAVPDDAELWRRIPSWHFVFDENQKLWRPSSAAFDNDPDGSPMSVVIAAAVIQAGRDATSVLIGHEGFALASFPARLARECGQGIALDPLPEEPAHAVVFGPKPRSVQLKLAKGSTWVIPPPGRNDSV